jgi:hypothetical protein
MRTRLTAARPIELAQAVEAPVRSSPSHRGKRAFPAFPTTASATSRISPFTLRPTCLVISFAVKISRFGGAARLPVAAAVSATLRPANSL